MKFNLDFESHSNDYYFSFNRIGRTGRAGVKGTAYTLITEKDKEMAGHIVRNLEQANQDVSKELMDLALKSSWFRSSRFRSKGGKGNFKMGLGYSTKDRPGFGQANSNEDALENYLTSKESSGPSGSKPGVIGQGRASALKSAFKSQYMSRFCKSSDTDANSTSVGVTNTINASDFSEFVKPTLLTPPLGPAPRDQILDSSSSHPIIR